MVHVAQSAAAFRLLAHDLHALVALVEERGLVQGFRGLTGDRRAVVRREPWQLDAEKYKKRNEVELTFGRMKENRRMAICYDKLNMT